MQNDLTKVKIFQQVLGWGTFLQHPVDVIAFIISVQITENEF